jgi:hypothetical protein
MPNFSGLWTAGQQYQAVGASTWPTLPGAPTIGTATVSGTTASVAFTAPSSAGFPATITGYIVTSSPGGLTGTGASSPISVTGLTAGTAYTFTVRAINATGTGPSSAASNSVTPADYVEDVFSTYLWTGNDSTQTITNSIDLSTKGGLVWVKSRNTTYSHILSDTIRGTGKFLSSNTTDAQGTDAQDVTAFNTTGFTIGNNARINNPSFNYVGWTFREQPKFFDIVTYTGNGSAPRDISHNLGSSPGCVIIKRTDSTGNWWVWHRSIANKNIYLDATDAADSGTNPMISGVSSTTFTLATNQNATMNINGATYVAYLFAHDAGGFGLTGTDNVISCGTFTTDGSGQATINLGYEPQWVMQKRTDSSTGGDWYIADNMRGMNVDGSAGLFPNTTAVEGPQGQGPARVTATGFTADRFANATYMYVAIRRGPMKVPTVGTTVYNAIARTGTAATAAITGVGFPPDTVWGRRKDANYGRNFDRLRGANVSLAPAVTAAEATPSNSLTAYTMDGFNVGADASEHINASGIPYIYWNFKRTPGFFDIVCYSGDGLAGKIINHNLGVAPELIIVKQRTSTYQATGWPIYCAALGNTKVLYLNTDAASTTAGQWASTTPSATTFTVDNYQDTNTSAPATYVAYLFATCPGVSKVGSYTGTATTKQIDCGFTGGARFVLIKRTDSTGNWYIWDTVRGIISGNDPYLIINNVSGSPTAEVTNTDYIDTYSAGFEISSTAPADINASGGTYIFLAIA